MHFVNESTKKILEFFQKHVATSFWWFSEDVSYASKKM